MLGSPIWFRRHFPPHSCDEVTIGRAHRGIPPPAARRGARTRQPTGFSTGARHGGQPPKRNTGPRITYAAPLAARHGRSPHAICHAWDHTPPNHPPRLKKSRSGAISAAGDLGCSPQCAKRAALASESAPPHKPVAALTAQARQDRRRRTSASPEIAVRIRPTTRSETFSHRVEGEPARAAGTVGRGQSPKTTAHRREGSRSLAPLGAAAGATPLFSRPRDIARRVGSARSPSRRPEIAPTPLQTPSPRRRAGKIWRLEPPSTPWAKSGPRRPIFEGARRAARRLRRAARHDRGQAAT